MLDFTLTTAQQTLQQQARDFALAEILPATWFYEDNDATPLFVLEKAFAKGFMSHDIPQRFSGRGLGVMDSVLISEEMAAACAGLATSIFDNSLGLVPLLLSSNTELQEQLLPQLATEFKLISFATSEPLAGSDVAGMRCRAKEDGDEYILNGTKFWMTNGGIADYLTVFATVDAKLGHKGICAFLLDRRWEGITTSPQLPKLGQCASNTAGVKLHNVRVPRSHLLAPPGEGFALAMRTFARTRPVISAIGLGIARSAMEFALDYARRRQAFGKTLAELQAIQFKLADMLQQVETARLLIWKSAWEADQGLDPNISAAIAKVYSSEAATRVVNEALQIFGGYGYTRMFPLEKLLRDVRLLTIYEGTSEIQRVVLGTHALKNYRPVMPPLDELPILRGLDLGDEEQRSTAAWRCRQCGHVHYGPQPPQECPFCFFPQGAFRRIWPPDEQPSQAE